MCAIAPRHPHATDEPHFSLNASGAFEDVAGLDAELEAYRVRTGHDVGIHVDGASGGFVVPFLWPDMKADFRLQHVVSMNLSGHKASVQSFFWAVWGVGAASMCRRAVRRSTASRFAGFEHP